MRVLLLGRSGFVGRNLYECLADTSDMELVAPGHCELDALDEGAVYNTLKSGEFDVVLNCLDVHLETDPQYAEYRLRMYHNLANHSDLYGKMIYFGSGAEYGRQHPVENVSEGDFGRVVPDDSHGFALYQMSLHAMSSDNIYNLRLFGIFGPYENWRRRFISNLICRGLFGVPLIMHQNRIMDYLHTDDLARMVSWAIRSTPKYHDYNATSGVSVELVDIATGIMERIGISDELLFCASDGFGNEYTSSNDRIKAEMGGFTPMRMHESIEKMIKYYRANISEIDYSELLLS